MSIDYTLIKARPTKYRGIMFRSQLEATWAAFFDQIGWPWEYEPFELSGWLPDFLLRGRGRDVLVEVKPVDITDHDVEVKITNAAKGCDAHLMICGRQPYFHGVYDSAASLTSWCGCDWGKGVKCHWMTRRIVQADDSGQYDMIFGHWDENNTLRGFASGRQPDIETDEFGTDPYMGKEVAAMWARAKNATQWRPPSWRA
jgi:hypothetical protein